jgi:glyoxylase-like metal-dependent hydrolase (beta-lactamase superfamily II)
MDSLADRYVREVCPGVFRLGTGLTAYYLLEDRGRFTLVDGAYPGYFPQLLGFLEERGLALDAIDAQILTHHHPDHRGMTEQVRKQADAPVHIHTFDAPRLDEKPSPPKAPIWRPRVLRAVAHMLRNGVARTPPILEVSTYDDGEVLDVPRNPRVLAVPGHTAGNCALFLDDDVIITGDALITVNIYTWDTGPLIPASFFNEDSERALDSLSVLEGLQATTLLPGHGPVWEVPIAEAVAAARRVGVY